MALYFLVALKDSAAEFEATLFSKFEAANRYKIEDGKWIVESPATTSKEFADSLGVVARESSFVVVPVTGYFGRAQPDLWEWLAAKIEAKVSAKFLAAV